MSDKSAKKILNKWKQHVPSEADVQDVLAVLEAYLSEWTRDIKGSGSHCKEVYHPMFEKLNLFDGLGRFSIVAHKDKVKHCYIKDVLKAIETLEMMKKVDDARSK